MKTQYVRNAYRLPPTEKNYEVLFYNLGQNLRLADLPKRKGRLPTALQKRSTPQPPSKKVTLWATIRHQLGRLPPCSTYPESKPPHRTYHPKSVRNNNTASGLRFLSRFCNFFKRIFGPEFRGVHDRVMVPLFILEH